MSGLEGSHPPMTTSSDSPSHNSKTYEFQVLWGPFPAWKRGKSFPSLSLSFPMHQTREGTLGLLPTPVRICERALQRAWGWGVAPVPRQVPWGSEYRGKAGSQFLVRRPVPGVHSRATVEPLEDICPGVPVQGQAVGHNVAHPL